MNKLRAYKILLLLLMISIVIVATFVIIKHVNMYNNEKKLQTIVTNINVKIEKFFFILIYYSFFFLFL